MLFHIQKFNKLLVISIYIFNKKAGHLLFNIHGLLGYGMKENYKKEKNWKDPLPGTIDQYKHMIQIIFKIFLMFLELVI